MTALYNLDPYLGLALCLLDLVLTVKGQADMADEEEADDGVDWKLILAYVCFAIGGILLLFGFVRLIYYIVKKRKNKSGSTESGKDLVRDYYSSPWLKGNTFANAQRTTSRDRDDDILRDVDVNAFYSTPADERTSRGANNRTDSRYRSHEDLGEDIADDPIYSIPHDSRVAQLNADEIDAQATYAEPVKPRNNIQSSDESLQTLQVGSLQQQRRDVLNRSADTSLGNDSGQAAVLSALDAATSGEVDALHYETIPGTQYTYVDSESHPKQYMHIDRTLAEEKEIEYTFSSSVYVHTF